jgi:glycosyltransferase involved in cell wall biosynthesis
LAQTALKVGKFMRRIIIFLTAYLPMQGGAELAVKDITDRLGDLNFDLICARLRRGFPKTEKIGNVKIHRVGFGSKIDKILLPFFGYLKAKKIYNRLEPASKKTFIIWGIMASWGSLAALIFKIFNPRVPFLLTLQEGDAEEYIKHGRWGLIGLSWKRLLEKVDYVQAISNYLADIARSFGYQGKIEIIPNGVDIEKIKNQISKIKGSIKNSKFNENGKIIITVSRLVEKNGLEDLINGFKLLIANCQFEVKLLILGSGPLEEKLKQQVENLNLKAKVNFLGDIPNDEVPEYLAIADVFVRPSLSEGLGTAFLEAMAAGVPVVGTRVGGIPDFLRDRETGLFCELKNPQDMAYKINLLLIDEALRQKIIANSFKLIEDKYDWNKIGRQMRDIFNQMREGKKILIATGLYPPDIGGPATYSKILKDELPKRGFCVEVLSFGGVRHLPKIIRHFIYFLKVLIKGRGADVIFAQDPVSVGFPAVLAAKILRKKFILKIVGDYAWEQNQIKKEKLRKNKSEKFKTLEEFQKEKFDIITEFRRWTQKFVARKADKIITPSKYLKRIVADGWGVPAERIEVVYNCMSGAEKADLSLDNQEKKIFIINWPFSSLERI